MSVYFRFGHRCLVNIPEKTRQIIFINRKTDFTLKTGYRTFLSDTTTNIESYARQRMFKIDQLQEDGKVKLFQTLQALSGRREAKKVIPFIIDSFHSAETKEECDIVESVIRLLRPENENGEQEFYFGAILMRMYHFLGMPDKALAVYRDPQFKSLFEDNTCHMVLMDLLYKQKQYPNVMDVFAGLQRFDTNCYTIAFGALFHINTPDSLKESQSLLKKIQLSSHALQRRAVLFSAMLALNQGKAKVALDCLSLCKPNNVTKNIKLLCRCRLGHSQEIFKALQDILAAGQDASQTMNNRIYQDTWLEIQSTMKKDNKSDIERMHKLEVKIRQAGLLSMQNTTVFLERPLPGDKDYKKERAKRSIERSKR